MLLDDIGINSPYAVLKYNSLVLGLVAESIYDPESVFELAEDRKPLPIAAALVGKVGYRFVEKNRLPFAKDISSYWDAKNLVAHSMTGELTWDAMKGYVRINTPRTQAVIGFLSAEPHALSTCTISNASRYGAVWVTAMDGDAPIRTARHLLITAVGPASTAIPRGAQVIDVTGMTVYPGLIDSETALGLIEISAESSTNDLVETSDEIMPQMHVFDAFHAESTLIPITRTNGITNAIVAPAARDTLPRIAETVLRTRSRPWPTKSRAVSLNLLACRCKWPRASSPDVSATHRAGWRRHPAA